jgi:hypothetical protein
MKRRRGSTTLLLALAIVALGVLGSVFYARLQLDAVGSRLEQERLAALLLGRSALTAGVTGTSTVKLPLGVATVEVKGRTEAVVTLNGHKATVTSSDGAWTERFDAAR